MTELFLRDFEEEEKKGTQAHTPFIAVTGLNTAPSAPPKRSVMRPYVGLTDGTVFSPWDNQGLVVNVRRDISVVLNTRDTATLLALLQSSTCDEGIAQLRKCGDQPDQSYIDALIGRLQRLNLVMLPGKTTWTEPEVRPRPPASPQINAECAILFRGNVDNRALPLEFFLTGELQTPQLQVKQGHIMAAAVRAIGGVMCFLLHLPLAWRFLERTKPVADYTQDQHDVTMLFARNMIAQVNVVVGPLELLAIAFFKCLGVSNWRNMFCLFRTIALGAWLGTLGFPVEVVVGRRLTHTRNWTNDAVETHAWVELNGSPVNESPEMLTGLHVLGRIACSRDLLGRRNL